MKPSRPRSKPDTLPIAKLGQLVNCEFVKAPLRDVVKNLSAQSKLEIQIDEMSIASLKGEPDTSVTCRLHGVRLVSALNLITESIGLAWIADRNSIQVTSIERSETTFTSVSYNVHDLVANDRAQEVLDIIQCTIAGTSWAVVGGPGKIASAICTLWLRYASIGKSIVLGLVVFTIFWAWRLRHASATTILTTAAAEGESVD